MVHVLRRRPPAGIVRGQKGKPMFDEFKPGDMIAEEKFIVTIPEDGTVIRYTISLSKSGGFAYGNGTCVRVHDDYPGTQDKYYDTRYLKECSTVEGFREWAFKQLRRELRPDCKIEREKEPPTRPLRRKWTTEYGVHAKSNDGKEEHTGGRYRTVESAEAFAQKCRRNGNRDVYVVERDVTEWRRVKK